MYILGLSFFYHDSAACLIKDGNIIAAVQEERFSRKKHDENFPKESIKYCLKEAGIVINDISYITYYEKPLVKFERILETSFITWPYCYRQFSQALLSWLEKKIWIPQLIKKELGYKGKIFYIKHHLSHAASAYFGSGFSNSAILTVDGVGEWETATLGVAHRNEITIQKSLAFPHSLGLLYSSFTHFLGFEVNSDEYKVMGLSAYGSPKFTELIFKKLVDLKKNGSFALNMKYFTYHYTLQMTGGAFEKLFDMPIRKKDSAITQVHKDIAASIQNVTEIILLAMTDYLYEKTKQTNLCLAGGVALNAVANGKILKKSKFKNIFVQPAAGDAGGALGAAFYTYHTILDREESRVKSINIFTGPSYSNNEIKKYLDNNKIRYQKYEMQELITKTAIYIGEQKIVGWFQGRAEFGPRALGNRSILADARNEKNREKLNRQIKRRESFRPFAPTVLLERAKEYFSIENDFPFMTFVVEVNTKKIPATTHVDGTARIQTVTKEANPLYYDLIKAFEKISGCAAIINTSFNIAGEPMVLTPKDAYVSFLKSDMDVLVLGNFMLLK
jgi:carbamoyltransferase